MKLRFLPALLIVVFAIPFLSFHNPVHKTKNKPNTCYDWLTVYAEGVTVNNVEIGSTPHQVNITSGTSEDFPLPANSTGQTITVTISIYGAQAAPRMRSLEMENPDQCITYPGIGTTGGTISGVKQCAAMIVTASHAINCP